METEASRQTKAIVGAILMVDPTSHKDTVDKRKSSQ
jgi:hypothetical protein